MEKWDKKWGEVRQMRLRELMSNSASQCSGKPGSARKIQTEPARWGGVIYVNITTGQSEVLQEIGNSPGQRGGSPDNTMVCPDSTR